MIKRWQPRKELTRKEEIIIKHSRRTRKLFVFLRMQREVIFDDSFQDELATMYRQTNAGLPPLPPAFLAMVTLLQGYHQISDAEAVQLSLVDMRWQMVLDCFGIEKPAFSQGALCEFRARLINADMDRRLLERTVEIAKKTKEFDWKKLPKDLRIGIDSRPLEGAGRVEDTINLLGHAARKVVECTAELFGESAEEVARKAGIPLVIGSSIKANLDIDWSDREQKDDAIDRLSKEIASLQSWIGKKNIEPEEPIHDYIAAVAQVYNQDIEETPKGNRISQGVAPDRRISVEDDEMRHGRKSKTKRFDGYKEHISTDLSTGLVVACAVTPANRPEEEATPGLQADMEHQRISIGELHIDRAYVNSDLADNVEAGGGKVVSKPWAIRSVQPGMFSKNDFKINLRDNTVTCPAGLVEDFDPPEVVEFPADYCGSCPLRGSCTLSSSGRGRTVNINADEKRQKRFRKLQKTKRGRQELRTRVGVEHGLAHIAARKGPRARYLGTRKNLFDLRRAAAIQNLETIQRKAA